MKKFIKALIAKWSIKAINWSFECDPKWTADDRDTFKLFLTTRTGQKIDRLMINGCNNQAHEAILLTGKEQKNLAYASGFAAGFRASWATVRTLSAFPLPPIEEDIEDQDHGQSDASQTN